MIFVQGVDIMRAIGRVGLKVEPALGPEIAQATASVIWAQNRQGGLRNPMPVFSAMFYCRGGKG